MGKLKTGVLISGRGSNLQALIDACSQPEFPAEISMVISNKADAYGLVRAADAGIPTVTINHRDFADRETFDRAVSKTLQDAGIEFLCLAGFMRILSDEFVEVWQNRLINIHPSLLPAFKGLDTHRRALEAGVRIAGCTVHFVRPALDDGPIIVQAAVPVLSGDTPDSLAERIIAQEHLCYPKALQMIAEGRVKVTGDKALILAAESGEDSTDQALVSP